MWTVSDRVILRTLVINLVFLIVLLWAFPTRAFVALSARGDGMLEGRSDPAAERTRRALLRCAEGLEFAVPRIAREPVPEAARGADADAHDRARPQRLFVNANESGSYAYAGSVEVNAKP